MLNDDVAGFRCIYIYCKLWLLKCSRAKGTQHAGSRAREGSAGADAGNVEGTERAMPSVQKSPFTKTPSNDNKGKDTVLIPHTPDIGD